jgi:hypothetical protein
MTDFIREVVPLFHPGNGRGNRNENQAAPFLVNPVISPVVIVTPDRDTPGIIARA